MTGKGGDEVRILDQFVDVADEGAAGHVAAGDLVDRDFLFGAGDSIQFSQKVCNSSLFEDDIDIIVASCVSSGIYIQTPVTIIRRYLTQGWRRGRNSESDRDIGTISPCRPLWKPPEV